MTKRILVVGCALLVALLLPVKGADAQVDPYPPGIAILLLSESFAEVGDPVTASAIGYRPGTTVDFFFESDPVFLGSATANLKEDEGVGVANLPFLVPQGTADGLHTVTSSGTGMDGQPLLLHASITIGSTPGEPGEPGLPATGSNSTLPLTKLGIALIGAGTLLALAARKQTAKATVSA